MGNLKGQINSYDMAICVTTEEINKGMAKVFDDPNGGLPKSWYQAYVQTTNLVDADGKPTETLAPDDDDDDDDTVEQDTVDTAQVDHYFDNKTDLNDFLKKNDIKHPNWILDAKLNAPNVSFKSVLSGGVLLQIPIASGTFSDLVYQGGESLVLKKYPLSDTKNNTYTVFTLDTLMANITHVAQQGETVDKELSLQALYADLENPQLKPNITSFGSPSVPMPDGVVVSLGAILTTMCQSSSYSKSYVIGAVSLPDNLATTSGPFAPTAIQAATYQHRDNTSIGSLNYNIMTNYKPLPTDANAGMFSDNPVPDGTPGVLYISYDRIMNDIILAHGMDAFQLKADDFNFDLGTVTASLKQDVPWGYDGVYGHYSIVKIYPDIESNRIKVDFTLDQVQKNCNAHRMKAEWSGYFSFSIEEGTLKIDYTQDETPRYTDETDTWKRVLEDIATLGLGELDYYFSADKLRVDIANSMSDASKVVIGDILSCAQLPGGSTFTYDKTAAGVKLTYMGLMIKLQYNGD